MIARQAYLLVGNGKSGKTTLQKRLIKHLCNEKAEKLNTNKLFKVTHPMAPRQFNNISFMNRSYQEKRNEYGSIEEFFSKYFVKADVVILSSHLISSDIKKMLHEAREAFYNVSLVLLENSLEINSDFFREIAIWPEWKNIIVLPNPITKNEVEIENQLNHAALLLTANLIENTKLC